MKDLYRAIIESCNKNEVVTEARKKTYSQDEINQMSEDKVNKLFEEDVINDDQVQRWYDYQDEVDYLAKDFIDNELKYYLNNEAYTLKDIEDMPYGGVMNDDRSHLTINDKNYSKVGKDKWEQDTTGSHTLSSTFTNKQIFDMIGKTDQSDAKTEDYKPDSNIIRFKSPIVFGMTYQEEFDHGLVDPQEDYIKKVNAYLDLGDENLADYVDEELENKVTKITMMCDDVGENIITTVELSEPLDDKHLSILKREIEGQLSDGIGEGLEQQELGSEDIDLEEEYEDEDEDGEWVTDNYTESASIECKPWWSGTENGIKWSLTMI